MTGSRRASRPGLARRFSLLAVVGAVLALAWPAGSASAAPVPCGGPQWATCDTRATDNGYQYRYQGGELTRVTLGDGPVAGSTGCGTSCPPDPAAVCDLLLSVGPSPDMTPQEAAAYNQAIAGCQTWLADPANGIPLADVQARLADYLRDQLLPKPTLTIQPNGHSVTGLQTIVYTQVPAAFAFNVDEPVLATISAVPTYRWEFGDGATGPNAPGRPYDPAISPRDFPDAYVDHQYKRPGTYQITLTVTWDATFTVPGVAQAFPLAPVTLVATAPVVVDEASGVLTGNS